MNFADYLDQFGGGGDDQAMPSAIPDSSDPTTMFQGVVPPPTPKPTLLDLLEKQRAEQEQQKIQVQRAKAMRDALLQEEVTKNKNLENTLNNTFTQGGRIKSAQEAAWDEYAKQFGGSYDPEAGKMNLGVKGKIAMALQALSNGIAAGQNKQPYVAPQDTFFVKALKDLEQQRDSATTLLNSRSQRTADSLVRASQGDSQQAITQEKNTTDAQLKGMALDIQRQRNEADSHVKQLDEAIKMLKVQADSGVAGAREKLLEAQTLHEAAKQRKDEADTQIKAIEQKFGKNAVGQAAGIMAENQGLDPKSPEFTKQWLENWQKIGSANGSGRGSVMMQPIPGSPTGETPFQRNKFDQYTKELMSSPEGQVLGKAQPYFQLMKEAYLDPTPGSDHVLLTMAGKVLDNFTTVRESEYKNALQAFSKIPGLEVLSQLKTKRDPNTGKIMVDENGNPVYENYSEVWDNVKNYLANNRLTPDQRKKIIDITSNIIKGAMAGVDAKKKRYEKNLDDIGMPGGSQRFKENTWDFDFSFPQSGGTSKAQAGTPLDAAGNPLTAPSPIGKGGSVTLKDGTVKTVKAGGDLTPEAAANTTKRALLVSLHNQRNAALAQKDRAAFMKLSEQIDKLESELSGK